MPPAFSIRFALYPSCIVVTRVTTIHEEDNTKSAASKRELGLFPPAPDMFKKLRQQQEAAKKFYGKEYHKSDYIFTWDDGRQYDPNYITRTFRKVATEFGKPEITLHKLRHTCASIMLDNGYDIKKVQYWLGHSDPSITLGIYAHYIAAKSRHQTNTLASVASGIEF